MVLNKYLSIQNLFLNDDIIEYIIENYANDEDGVRNLKRCLEIIHTKLNLYRLMKPGSYLFDKEQSLEVTFPFKLTNHSINKLIKFSSQCIISHLDTEKFLSKFFLKTFF